MEIIAAAAAIWLLCGTVTFCFVLYHVTPELTRAELEEINPVSLAVAVISCMVIWPAAVVYLACMWKRDKSKETTE